MKHTELHTWTLQYCKETFNSHVKLFDDEIRLFNASWKTVHVNVDRYGEVRIIHQCRRTAEAAALSFQHCVSRHDWWKEIL